MHELLEHTAEVQPALQVMPLAARCLIADACPVLHRSQHRAVDFRDFLDEIDRQTSSGLVVHVICDKCEDHGVPHGAGA
ncbi:hypothetical protein ACWEWX_48015 [Streptomyces asiaticus]